MESWCKSPGYYVWGDNKSLYINGNEIKDIFIPENVEKIPGSRFSGFNITAVTFSKSVKEIGPYCFNNCTNLSSLIIPEGVEIIEMNAFYGCKSLNSVTLPNSLTRIGQNAFDEIELKAVVSLIEEPFSINGDAREYRTFTRNTFKNTTLYVPVGTKEKYKSTSGWKDFVYIEEGNGPKEEEGDITTKKCAKPSIRYKNGELKFESETEDAIYHYSISDDDIKSGNGNEVQLGVTYYINVYATKEGYENSETVTGTLCWIDVEPKTEGITNGVASVRAQAVLVQSNGGILNVSGVDIGTQINVYDMSGQMVGSAYASGDNTTIDTILRSGEVGIIKIGDKAIKVLIK